jgi:hypothetical protein
MVFVGVQPSFTQVPPTCLCLESRGLVVDSRGASKWAAPWPAPMTMRSYEEEFGTCVVALD